jgi:hypothetical protein
MGWRGEKDHRAHDMLYMGNEFAARYGFGKESAVLRDDRRNFKNQEVIK